MNLMVSPERGVGLGLKLQKVGKKKMPTFTAKSAVSWFVTAEILSSRKTGTELGQRLQSFGYIAAVQVDQVFEDNDNLFYVVDRKSKEKKKRKQSVLGINISYSSLEEGPCRRLSQLTVAPLRAVSPPKVTEAMRDPVAGLKIKNRRFMMKTYYRFFFFFFFF